MRELNLAARPFQNLKPLWRIGALLWALGLLLCAVNFFLYRGHFSGRSENRQVLVDLRDGIAAEEAQISELERDLQGLDLAAQNEQVQFLNRVISERSFSWSRLFDRLTEALPAQVRLSSLTPRFESSTRRLTDDTSVELGEAEILFSIRASAKSSEAILQLIDNLFAHPSFRSPDLSGEAQREGGEVDFTFTVVYLAAAAEAEVPEPVEAGAEAEEAAPDGEAEPAPAAESRDA